AEPAVASAEAFTAVRKSRTAANRGVSTASITAAPNASGAMRSRQLLATSTRVTRRPWSSSVTVTAPVRSRDSTTGGRGWAAARTAEVSPSTSARSSRSGSSRKIADTKGHYGVKHRSCKGHPKHRGGAHVGWGGDPKPHPIRTAGCLAVRVADHQPARGRRGRRRDPLAGGDPRRRPAHDPHLRPGGGAARVGGAGDS